MSAVCSEGIWNKWSRNRFPCGKKAKVERDGKPYCGVHDPEKRKAKDAERQVEWDRKSAIRKREYDILKACEGLTVEQVKAALTQRSESVTNPK